MRALIFFTLSISSFLFCENQTTLACQKRIKNHLLIHDYATALSDLKIFLAQHPQSQQLHELMIRTLSKSARGVEAYRFYIQTIKLFPSLEKDLNLIEMVCWAILEQSLESSQYNTSITSLIGVSLTHDAKAVKILEKTMQSSRPYLRMLSVKIASEYGDESLRKKIVELFNKEQVFYVKEELIRALGRLKIHESKDLLENILIDKRSMLSEKALAAEALIYFNHHLTSSQLQTLISSQRMGLRFFAAQVIGYFGGNENVDLLKPLLSDNSYDVKIAALNALLTTRIEDKSILSKVEELLEDSSEDVVIASARLLSFFDLEKALDILEGKIYSHDPQIKLQAAVALASGPIKARERAFKILTECSDPYVKLNLATTLLGFEKDEGRLCEEIAIFLSKNKEKIAPRGSNNPSISFIAKSDARHIPQIPHYPEALDQNTRLSLLNQLAIFRYGKTEVFIKKYLKEASFGITFAASKTLIEEGPIESAQIIKELLSDPDEMIQIQAALVLALIGADPEATKVLEKAFHKVDKQFKITICEALGHLGSRSSIPFLTSLLDDPFNMMRTIAAASIIQCIYH